MGVECVHEIREGEYEMFDLGVGSSSSRKKGGGIASQRMGQGGVRGGG